jgi:hypothetical protein
MWKFWLYWIAGNTLGLGTGFILLDTIRGSSYALRYFGDDIPTILDCVLASLVLGIIQWLILNEKIPRIGKTWFLTSIIGLSIGAALSSFFESLSVLAVFNKYSSFAEDLTVTAESGLIGGFLGGIVTGITQSIVLQKWLIWIPVNACAWSIAWAAARTARVVVGNLIYRFTHIEISLQFQLIVLGCVLGFISSSITGVSLVWLLRRDHLME